MNTTRACHFGVSVAVSGDTAIVGAHLHDTSAGSDAGSAYVFVRSGELWSEQQKLVASDGLADEQFGWSVAIDGETAIVGAIRGPVGVAYVFVRSGTTWTEHQRLTAPEPGAQRFGWSVSIAGDTVMVGAPSAFGPGGPAGAAYVFVRSGAVWGPPQKLSAPDGAAGDNAGHSVSIDGDVAIIGAQGRDTPSSDDVGAAYVFVRSGTLWSPGGDLTVSDRAAFDLFGWAVAISRGTVVSGAILDETTAGRSGSAYVFHIGAAFFGVVPCRLVDTRTSGPALAANSTRTFGAAGRCGVPADAHAVAANLVAVNPGDGGNLRLFATGQAAPLASTLNFTAGRTRANNAIALLGLGGQVTVRCDMPPGSTASTHFVLDVTGYFK